MTFAQEDMVARPHAVIVGSGLAPMRMDMGALRVVVTHAPSLARGRRKIFG